MLCRISYLERGGMKMGIRMICITRSLGISILISHSINSHFSNSHRQCIRSIQIQIVYLQIKENLIYEMRVSLLSLRIPIILKRQSKSTKAESIATSLALTLTKCLTKTTETTSLYQPLTNGSKMSPSPSTSRTTTPQASTRLV